MLRKLLVMIFFIIFIVPLVYAANDFFAYSDSKISVCSCGEVIEKKIFITNGDVDNFFVIEKSGSGSDFVQVYPSSFELKQGEQAAISEFISTPCVQGNYGLELKLRTDTNLLKVINQDIVSSACNNVGIRLIYKNDTGCRCNVLAYVFNVSNTGNYDENYFFSVDKYSEYANFVPDSVKIRPGSGFIVNLLMVPDCSALLGEFNFVVTSQKSNFAVKYPLKANINSSCKSNMPLYRPKNVTLSKYLSDSLLYFPLVVILLVLLLLFFKRRSGPKKVSEEPRHYPWENKFAGRNAAIEEPKRQVNWIAIIALLVVVALIVFLLSRLYYSLNWSLPYFNSSSTNITMPAGPVLNQTASSDELSKIKGWLSSYFVYFLIGVVILVAIIAVIELVNLRRQPKKE